MMMPRGVLWRNWDDYNRSLTEAENRRTVEQETDDKGQRECPILRLRSGQVSNTQCRMMKAAATGSQIKEFWDLR